MGGVVLQQETIAAERGEQLLSDGIVGAFRESAAPWIWTT